MGERLKGCNPRNLDTEKAQALSPEPQAALGPLLQALESLSERITEYNQRIEAITQALERKVGICAAHGLDDRHSHGEG